MMSSVRMISGPEGWPPLAAAYSFQVCRPPCKATVASTWTTCPGLAPTAKMPSTGVARSWVRIIRLRRTGHLLPVSVEVEHVVLVGGQVHGRPARSPQEQGQPAVRGRGRRREQLAQLDQF